MSIIKLHTMNQKDAQETLQEAMDLDFETVVIVGISKDKTVHLKKSANDNTLEVIGALDAVKMHVFENWD